jgi:hypothetical protein
MLHLMLASGPGVVACGEIGGWFRIARHRANSCLPDKFLPLQNVPANQFHRAALDHFNADFIIDSTKGLEWVLDVNKWATYHRLRVYNILIWKSPEDQAYSQWKRGKRISFLRYKWYHNKISKCGIDFFTVSYSELVDNPSRKLKDICKAIGMRYFDGKEQFWEENHHFAGSSSGVRNQVERGQSSIQREPTSTGFKLMETKVREKLSVDPSLQRTLSMLQSKEVSQISSATMRCSHTYNPSLIDRLEHHFWKYTKRAWLRTRWNVIEPWLGDQIRSVKNVLSPTTDPRRGRSFDPNSSA